MVSKRLCVSNCVMATHLLVSGFPFGGFSLKVLISFPLSRGGLDRRGRGPASFLALRSAAVLARHDPDGAHDGRNVGARENVGRA